VIKLKQKLHKELF